MPKISLILSESEKKSGYVKSYQIEKYFSESHKFDGAEITYLDGSKTNIYEHNRGLIHTHNSVLGRIDGFTEAFNRLNSNCIDFSVDNNIIHIEEVVSAFSTSTKALDKEAAEVRRLMGL